MGGTRLVAAVSVLALLSISSSAQADEPPGLPVDEPAQQIDEPQSGWRRYLVDGGAIPFLWAPLAGRILLDKYAVPRDGSPLLFSDDEGGAPKSSWQIPGWAISSLGGVSVIGMIASGDGSRAYHVKGLAESLSTGVLVTGLIKTAVGRHRPFWTADDNTSGSRRSFPSGHSTQAFAIATYTILFLRGHVFDKYRGDRTLPWWEAAAYGGIALGATALAGERVIHNRHHLSDVVVGGLLGTATSSLFYLYQERRYDRHIADESRKQLTVTPTQGTRGATVGLSFVW